MNSMIPPAVSGGVTISWSPSPASRTVLPTFPAATTFDLRLKPAVGDVFEKKGITSSSWTFTNLTSGSFTVTITGYDTLGRVLMVGTSAFDTATLTTLTVAVPLSYIISGTGTGQIHLTITTPNTLSLHTTSLQMVDPAGTVTTPALTAGPNAHTFTYTNTAAPVGNYQLYLRLATGTLSAQSVESLLVAQNLDTVGTVAFTTSNFNATYVPVTGVTLAETATVGLTGNLALAAVLAPGGASNTLVVWTTDKPDIATVDQNGIVTGKALGSAVITATSVDKPTQADSCTVSVETLPVTYDANGGTGIAPTDSHMYAAGEEITLLGNIGSLAKSGYGFGGWNTKADGTGTVYAPGSKLTMGNSSIVLYAFWPSALQVNYFANDATEGTVPVVQDVLPEQSTVIQSNTGALAKTGYAFTSWNTLPTGLGTVYLPGATLTMGASGVNLYAFWNTVVYDPNGATGGTVPVADFQYGTGAVSVSVMGNPGNLTRTNFRFNGWGTKADGSGVTYKSGSIFTKSNGVVILYAKWVPSYTVTYDANGATGGTVPVSPSDYLTSEKATVIGNSGSLTRTNALFTGWNTKADRTGTRYDSGSTITISATNVILYASWTPQVASVSAGTSTLLFTNENELWVRGEYFNNDGSLTQSYTKFVKTSPNLSGIRKSLTSFAHYSNWGQTYIYMLYLNSNGALWGVGNGSSAWGSSTSALNQVASAVTDVVSNASVTLIIREDRSLWATGSVGSLFTGFSATTGFVPVQTEVAKVWVGGNADMNTPHYSVFIQKTDGTFWASGYNGGGELGLGDTTNRGIFTEITSLKGIEISDIRSSDSATFLLRADGTVWVCGMNSFGSFGTGSINSTAQTHFVQVSALGSDNVAISTKHGSSMVLKADGSLLVAGRNNYGQLGDGTRTGQSNFVQILTDVVSAEFGWGSSVYFFAAGHAIKKDGSYWYWTGNGHANSMIFPVAPEQVLF